MFWLPGTEKPFCHLRMSFSIKPQKPFFVALMILTIVITAGPIVLAEPSKAGTHSSKSNDVKAGSTLTGKASFYSDSLNGHKTAKERVLAKASIPLHQTGFRLEPRLRSPISRTTKVLT